jgi:hypothetical protein
MYVYKHHKGITEVPGYETLRPTDRTEYITSLTCRIIEFVTKIVRTSKYFISLGIVHAVVETKQVEEDAAMVRIIPKALVNTPPSEESDGESDSSSRFSDEAEREDVRESGMVEVF